MGQGRVKLNQIWKDKDTRNPYPQGYRTVIVQHVTDKYVYGVCEQSEKRTRIQLKRFVKDYEFTGEMALNVHDVKAIQDCIVTENGGKKLSQDEIVQIAQMVNENVSFAKCFNDMAQLVHDLALGKGWYEQDRSDGELLMLVVSELGEATEALRDDNPRSKKIPSFSQAEEEIADAVIRLMDMATFKGWDIGGAIVAKHEYNKTRPKRHGGKRF